MQRHLFNDHSQTTSCIHRLDPRVKILAALIYIILAVITAPQHLQSFAILGGLLLWTIAFARIPLALVLSRAAVVLPFTGIAALGLLLTNDQNTVHLLGLPLPTKGLWLLAGVLMKSLLSVTAMLTLIATTPLNDLLKALRQLKVPPLFLEILALTIRYIAVLTDEIHRLRRAAAARGYKPTWILQAKTIGQLIGNLFIRSYERSERIYNAMKLRGYGND